MESSCLNLQVKNFLQRLHGAIRQRAIWLNEEVTHLALPAVVDFAFGHASPSALKVFRLEIADEKAIVAQEQRVIVPSGFAKGRQHLRPHAAMATLVLLEPFWFYLQDKTDTLHRRSSVGSFTWGLRGEQFNVECDHHFISCHGGGSVHSEIAAIDLCTCGSSHARVAHRVFDHWRWAVHVQGDFFGHAVNGQVAYHLQFAWS